MMVREEFGERESTMTSAKTVYDKFVEFEERAASVYLHLASHFSENRELSSFWLEMGMQEKQHAGLLQFCAFEQLFAGDLPDDATTQRVEELYQKLEKRAANPELGMDEAFQVALELETSEVNDIYCRLTTTTHNSMYLWRRKVASLASGHLGFLAAAARKFGAGEEVLRQLNLLAKSAGETQ
jgi:hypothetical protein